MRALLVVAALTTFATPAVADDPDEGLVGDSPEMAAARDAGKLFFLAIAGSEGSYLQSALRAPVTYANLRFEDPACAKRFAGKGKVTKAKLRAFATCVLSLVRHQDAGDLGFDVRPPTSDGKMLVVASNLAATFSLGVVPAKDGTYKVELLIGQEVVAGAGVHTVVGAGVAAPTAKDLRRYVKGIKGKGRLIATIQTSHGTLHCELFEQQTPITVANFVGLATGKHPWLDPRTGAVQTGVKLYDGLTFHRVISGFMIQGGDPMGTGVGGPGYQFANEASLHHRPGALAMANAGKGTNGSQFFIDAVENKQLDGDYTVFGQCAELDVVTAIAGVETSAGDMPTSPVTIEHVTFSRTK